MEKKRFFVGNLPHEIDEDVIRSRFSKYGEVLSVELKFRYSGLDQNEIISTFAFVNLQGSQESLSACLKKLPRKKWLGKEITVEFAKESILNKLENERRAAKDNISGKTNDATKMPHSCFESNSGDLYENNEESVKIEDIKTSTLSKINFNSKSNSNILTKLENFSNVWKDCDEFSGRKITKFDDSSDFSTTVNERHENVFPKKIIGSKEKFNFLDSNKFSDIDKKNNGSESKFSRNFINADEKRLKSIKEMKKAIDQRKQTIKKALSSVDSGNLNKKIVFNDDDDDTDYDKSVDNLHKTEKVNHYDKKSKLFNDDSCDENEVLHSFDVKQQFEGDKGKKLFELQSRFGNDSRFYMDEKFYESDEEKNDNEKQDIERLEDFDEKEETINDEVKKQLEILQSIVGTEFSGQQKKQKLKHVTSATGVRYDPSVPEHEKFIVKPSSNDKNEEDVKQKKSKKSKNKQKEEVKEQECVNKPSVSNETYYEVADELKKTFKSAEKTTFSFTELFNSSAEQTLQKKEEKDSFKNANLNSKKKNAPYNNFIDDRFGGDFSAEQDTPKLDEHKEVIKTGSLWHENFFYKISDPRFKEAHQFFSREDFEVDTGNFEGKRKMLKKIIKKKVMNKIRKDRPFKRKIGGMPKHRKNFKRRKLQ